MQTESSDLIWCEPNQCYFKTGMKTQYINMHDWSSDASYPVLTIDTKTEQEWIEFGTMMPRDKYIVWRSTFDSIFRMFDRHYNEHIDKVYENYYDLRMLIDRTYSNILLFYCEKTEEYMGDMELAKERIENIQKFKNMAVAAINKNFCDNDISELTETFKTSFDSLWENIWNEIEKREQCFKTPDANNSGECEKFRRQQRNIRRDMRKSSVYIDCQKSVLDNLDNLRARELDIYNNISTIRKNERLSLLKEQGLLSEMN